MTGVGLSMDEVKDGSQRRAGSQNSLDSFKDIENTSIHSDDSEGGPVPFLNTVYTQNFKSKLWIRKVEFAYHIYKLRVFFGIF